jgi:hypothetical protein
MKSASDCHILSLNLNVIEAFFRLNSATFVTNLKINSSSNYIRVEEESIYVVRLVELTRNLQEKILGNRNSMNAADFKLEMYANETCLN